MDEPTAPIPDTSDLTPTQVMPAANVAPGPPPGPPTVPSPRGDARRNWLILVGALVVVLLLGACVGAFLWQRRQAEDAELRANQAEQRLRDLEEQDSVEPTEEPEPEPDAESKSEAEPDAEPGDEAEDEDGRFIGYIVDIYNVAQARFIQIDYIQFLTGDEAAAAAAAAGDESPPPNDYYILNENPRLRDFNVREGLEVTMWTWNMETDGVTRQTVPFDIWWDAIDMGGEEQYLANPYWVTIDNDTAIEIEEQYLP